MNKLSLREFVFIILVLMPLNINAQKIIAEDRDTRKFMREIISEANQGAPDSQCLIGVLCLRGDKYLKKDIDLGLAYLRKSSNQNYAPAFYFLGDYSRAEGNVDDAVGYYKKSLEYFIEADTTNRTFWRRQGRRMSLEYINEADTTFFHKQDAIDKIWEIAAEKVTGGSLNDYDDYDTLVEDLINKMTPDALELFEYIAEYNDIDTIEMLMLYFYYDLEDYEKGVYYAKKAYEQNYYESCFWLADAYYWGRGVEKDIEKGISYYEEGANNASLNQGICREVLSGIFYKDKIMDKAFRYSYDYIYKSEDYLIENSSSTRDILQVLAECYRFGRGTEKNEFLADLYYLMSMTYYFGWKEETIAKYWDLNLDDDTELLKHIITVFNSHLTPDMICNYPSASIIRGLYKIMIDQEWFYGKSYFLKAYNLPNASVDDCIFIIVVLKGITDIYPSALTNKTKELFDDFEYVAGLTIEEIDQELFQSSFPKVFFEQILVFEQNVEECSRYDSSIPTKGRINGYEYVDLGLSVKWATCNVGAASQSDFGDFFAWGEITSKSSYEEDNSVTNELIIGDIGGNALYDPATAKWGEGWRLPTVAECKELVDNCLWTLSVQDEHPGYIVTSKINGNSIFLPQSNGSAFRHIAGGSYWSSTPATPPAAPETAQTKAYYFAFDTNYYNVYVGDRFWGYNVRPVSE